jgi:hypothetical protein
MTDIKDVEEILVATGSSLGREFCESVMQDVSLIAEFCRIYSVDFARVDATTEASGQGEIVLEPIYFFSDDLGGYTRQGLENSLKED